jgi:hypothetical protein
MRFTNIGIPAVGMAMLISNALAGVTSGIAAIIFIHRLKQGKEKWEM